MSLLVRVCLCHGPSSLSRRLKPLLCGQSVSREEKCIYEVQSDIISIEREKWEARPTGMNKDFRADQLTILYKPSTKLPSSSRLSSRDWWSFYNWGWVDFQSGLINNTLLFIRPIVIESLSGIPFPARVHRVLSDFIVGMGFEGKTRWSWLGSECGVC